VKTVVLYVLIVISFLSTGALGMVTKTECEDTSKYPTISEKMVCYHYAAVSIASISSYNNIEGRNAALSLCNDIATVASSSSLGDTALRIRDEANVCYTDIARLLRDSSICSGIQDDSSLGSVLAGAPVTKEICKEQADKEAKLRTDIYMQNKDSMCNIIFVFPLLLLFIFKTKFK
jgi:hypothetical protein